MSSGRWALDGLVCRGCHRPGGAYVMRDDAGELRGVYWPPLEREAPALAARLEALAEDLVLALGISRAEADELLRRALESPEA